MEASSLFAESSRIERVRDLMDSVWVDNQQAAIFGCKSECRVSEESVSHRF